MAIAKSRGTKRKCQNEECALPFYDLDRADYACPTCGAAFDVKLIAPPRGPAPARGMPRRIGRSYAIVAPAARALEVEPEAVEAEVEAEVETAEDGVLVEALPEQDADQILEPDDEDDPVIEIELDVDVPADDSKDT